MATNFRDPREVERAVDDLRTRISATLADETLPAEDRRDVVNRLTGEVNALEPLARDLREQEIEAARAAVSGGAGLAGQQEHAAQMDAFMAFVKSGDISNAALLTTPDTNGGYLMPKPIVEQVIDVVRKQNPIAAEATIFELSKPGTFKVELPTKTASTVGGWAAETDARPATAAPTLGQRVLECFEWYANPEVTQSFLDAVANGEDFIRGDIADTFGEVSGTAFAVGTGTTQPTGVFSTAAQSIYAVQRSSTIDSLDAAQLLSAYFTLPAKFLPNAKWYVKGATVAVLSALAWPGLVDTPLVRWEGGKPTILGKEIVITDDAPGIGNGAFPMAFGDMRRGYAVGLHTNITVLRDPYTNKPKVGFYSTGRVGGTPWDSKALLLLKSDNV
ncbi:MAG: phage major capsid protein [Patescibacteria group bacterium]|nr:phage major capsid protein [Patescibacteria group bacterium]